MINHEFLEEIVDTLLFYSNEKHYEEKHYVGSLSFSDIDCDKGEMAREILKKIKGENINE